MSKTRFAPLSASTFRMTTGLLVSLGVLTSLPARADDWSSLGLASGRGRLSAERSGDLFSQGSWQHDLQSTDPLAYRALMSSPAVADGYLVFATQRNIVRALREVDGMPLWEVKAGGAVYSSPAIWRGWAFVVGVNQQLYALRLADGSTAWQLDLGSIAYASPTIVDDSLFVSTADPSPRVLRIDAATGRVLWQAGKTVLQQASLASVAVADGRVVVGEMGGRYHSFALEDGSWQWTADTGGKVNLSSPLILGGRVYMLPGGGSPSLHAVDLASGARIDGWPLTIPVPVEAGLSTGRLLETDLVASSPAASGDTIVYTVRVDQRYDTNADGGADTFVSREIVVAVDARLGTVLWSVPNGRLETTDENQVPTHGFCSTPALYRTGAGETLAAVASSVSPRLRVLAAADGVERWSAPLSGPTRGSPLLANGRLVVATNAGVVHSFLSASNEPPRPPLFGMWPADGRDVDASSVKLQWGAAFDPEGSSLRYEVRIDDDGEILHDWALAYTTSGEQSVTLAERLAPEHTYTFSVRARDVQGAYSAWTPPAVFRAVGTPAVSVDGQEVGGLEEALTAARSGQTIKLGAGVFPLSRTLQLPADVSLRGAGPHLTVLTGQGLAVAVAAGPGSALDQLTVADARIGVEVTGGELVRLTNVILRDNIDSGLHVTATGRAEMVSATVARNGVGVRAEGETEVRNALVTANDIGIAASAPELVSSFYNNVFQNRSVQRQNTDPGATDLALAVAFESPGSADLRLASAQPTTDRGDPADRFENEPEPNGARINIGAFGNTAFAELSATIPGPSDPSYPFVPVPTLPGRTDHGRYGPAPPPPPEWPGDPSPPVAGGDSDGRGDGCSLGGPASSRSGGCGIALAALALVLARSRRRQNGA